MKRARTEQDRATTRHTIASLLARQSAADRKAEREWVYDCWASLLPPSKITLSEWADRDRILSSESAAEHGEWVTATVPYEKAIMDAITDPLVPRVVVQKGAQLGITDSAILNPVGYHIIEDPCPILIVQPTVEMAETFSSDRLQPMLRDSPALRDKVPPPGADGNKLLRKTFNGGYVALGGANSAASLSGRPVRVVLLDDVDRYPISAGREGNPLKLAIARTSAFWNRKVVIVSSPSIAGVSHVEREIATTTCEHWYLPCPSCNYKQELDWERIDLDTLEHKCASCGEAFEKYLWLAGDGDFVAHRLVDDRGNKVAARGFFVSGLVNPWIEWDILRDEYTQALAALEEGDVELMKAFKNTRLGLLFEETGSKVKIDLYQRRELYQCEVPDGVVVITAGVDVSDQALHADVIGWGKGRENWHIDYVTIPGDPRTDEPWESLDDAVYNRVFMTSDGRKMRVRRMCVDSSHLSDHVYAYTKTRQPRCIAIKGMGGLGKAPISAITLSKSNRCVIASLGVDTLKEEIMNRLNVTKLGPGYCHFPRSDVFDEALRAHEPINGYDIPYFQGLRAEQRVMKSKHGFKTYIWIKRLSQRNESWDVFVYALAALQLPHSGIRLDTMKRDAFAPPTDDPQRTKSAFGAQAVPAALASDTSLASSAQRAQTPSAVRARARFGAINRPIY
jgi:phage terminase large subunit GpA-like protein